MRYSARESLRRERRRVALALVTGLLLFVLCFLSYFLLQLPFVQRCWLYPFHHQETIERFSEEYHVDCYLTAAVIKGESGFRTDAQSHRGAVGLMQLMPNTARWISTQLEDEDFSLEHLQDPDVNIRYGIWYLSSLEEEFGANDILILAAYNAGRGNVRDWMEKYHWDQDFHDIDAIPFEETKEYVRRVLRYEQKYRSLYGNSGG